MVGDTGSPRFVKPGALVRIWGSRTLRLLLVGNAEYWNRINLCVPRSMPVSMAWEHFVLEAKAVGDSAVPQDKRGCHNKRPCAISEETQMKIKLAHLSVSL